MEDLVKDSIDIGLNEICITDHVDYGVKSDWINPKKFNMMENALLPMLIIQNSTKK
jgi:histidinol-phosphatase (PHP family)